MELRNPRQLYRKLFYTYTIVVVIVAVGLMAFFITTIRRRNYQVNLDNAQRIHAEAVSYLTESDDIASYFHRWLYQSSDIMRDMENFFMYSTEKYIQERLDNYWASNSLQNENTYSFVESAFSAFDSIKRIELISYEKRDITFCYPDKTVYPAKRFSSRLDEILENKSWTENEFYFRKEIHSMDDQRPLGCMVFVYGTEKLENLMKDQNMVDLIITHQNGSRVWSSTAYDRKEFAQEVRNGTLAESTDSIVENQSVQNYQIYVIMDRAAAYRISLPTLAAVSGIGLALILLGELLINWYLKRLNNRLALILNGLEQVMKGDLSQRLAVNVTGDELDIISDHYNNMCEQLDLYIQRSYLAEIEQKNAQMQALQNQINPHFLYNTLEAIRMKAITNGDREVGKMLYSMAVTFRAQLKEKDVITLEQELNYCQKYMELFEYRYQGRFLSEVSCPEELKHCPVIKFVLQPLIENYFVHGIRMESSDNRISIRAEHREELLRVSIEDNGRGMHPEEIRRKNIMLKDNVYERQASIGIANVNRRVKAVYGPEFGVQLAAREQGGVCVILDIRYEEGNPNEESDAG